MPPGRGGPASPRRCLCHSKSFRVYAVYNPASQGDKSFELHLLPASAGAVVGEPSTLQCTILDMNRTCRILTPPRLNPTTGRTEFTVDGPLMVEFYLLGSDDLIHWDVAGYYYQHDRASTVVEDREGSLHRQRFYRVATFSP